MQEQLFAFGICCSDKNLTALEGLYVPFYSSFSLVPEGIHLLHRCEMVRGVTSTVFHSTVSSSVVEDSLFYSLCLCCLPLRFKAAQQSWCRLVPSCSWLLHMSKSPEQVLTPLR